jgi:hypothetical protein
LFRTYIHALSHGTWNGFFLNWDWKNNFHKWKAMYIKRGVKANSKLIVWVWFVLEKKMKLFYHFAILLVGLNLLLGRVLSRPQWLDGISSVSVANGQGTNSQGSQVNTIWKSCLAWVNFVLLGCWNLINTEINIVFFNQKVKISSA